MDPYFPDFFTLFFSNYFEVINFCFELVYFAFLFLTHHYLKFIVFTLLRPNVEGMFCDRCRENMFNLSAGCQPCPACYGLVQQRVNTHRKTLAELHVLLKQASGEEFSLNDTEFESVLDQVKMTVNELHEDAQKITNTDGPSVNDIARLKVGVGVIVFSIRKGNHCPFTCNVIAIYLVIYVIILS